MAAQYHEARDRGALFAQVGRSVIQMHLAG